MKKMVEFFLGKAGTGEIVTIAYGGGSHPGESRQLIIVSCSDTYFRAYEGSSHQPKQYKIEKVLWVEDSSGTKITSRDNVQALESALPTFESFDQYADFLKKEFEHAGWYVYQSDDLFGVGTCFKDGKPKKTPSIAVSYINRSNDIVWDLEKDDLVTVKKEPTGRKRPWRVDSWRFKEGRSFQSLHSAMELFVKEVRASDPQHSKGMFAGH
jgi:hypothetical protein